MIQPAFEILNQRGTPMFFSDVFANIPTAGIPGRIFIRTDSPYGIYRDTGSSWDQIAGSGGGGGISGSGAAGQVTFWDGASSVSGSNNLWFDNASGKFLVGTNNTTGAGKLQVTSATGDDQLRVWGATSPSIRIDNAVSGATQRFVMGLATATNNFIQGSAAGNICISTASANPLLFGMWQTTNASEVMRISTANNLLIGKTTDSGQRLQIVGNGAFITGGFEEISNSEIGLRLQGSATTKDVWLSIKNTNASGKDYIIRSGTNGRFEIAQWNGSISQSVYLSDLTFSQITANSVPFLFGRESNLLSGLWIGVSSGSQTLLNSTLLKNGNDTILSSSSLIRFYSGSGDIGRIFSNTGNWLIQTGGTFTDAGYKLDVSGTARFTGMINVVNINIGRGAAGSTQTLVIGELTGTNTITGNFNHCIGYQSGKALTSGQHNTFFGRNAGQNVTTGSQNIVIGSDTGQAITTNTAAIAIGYLALNGGNNGYCVAIGNEAGKSIVGDANVIVGPSSFRESTSGQFNSSLGYEAGRLIQAGTGNLTCNNSIFIGAYTRANANSETNQIVIGYDARGLGTNTTVIGNSSTSHAAIYGNLLLGSTTNQGQKLYVNGSVRIDGQTAATAGGSAGLHLILNLDGTNYKIALLNV